MSRLILAALAALLLCACAPANAWKPCEAMDNGRECRPPGTGHCCGGGKAICDE